MSSNRLRLVLGSVLFVSAFWLGWYTLGPPMNLFSYIVLATAAWVSPRHVVGWRLFKACLVALGTLAGTFSGVAVFGGLARVGVVTFDTQASPISHTVFWLCVGLGTGIVGGFLGGRAL